MSVASTLDSSSDPYLVASMVSINIVLYREIRRLVSKHLDYNLILDLLSSFLIVLKQSVYIH